MSNVIFARPRYEYGSYTDLYRLIELSGYPLVFFDEIDVQSDNCYIMTILNGENQNGWDAPRARLIWWDIEWRLEGEYPRIPGVSEVWASDCWYADKIGAKYVPMGSHPDLPNEPLQDCPKVWDVVTLTYDTYRRQWLKDRMTERGISLAPKGWGLERHSIMQQSRAMLHIHQNDNAPTIAPQRWALAAAYKLPMISETVRDAGLLASAGLFADYLDMINTVRDMHNNESLLNEYATLLHEALCNEYTFRKCVEVAL